MLPQACREDPRQRRLGQQRRCLRVYATEQGQACSTARMPTCGASGLSPYLQHRREPSNGLQRTTLQSLEHMKWQESSVQHVRCRIGHSATLVNSAPDNPTADSPSQPWPL